MDLQEAYRILGVTPASSSCEIKDAYKQLALECHPDKNTDNRLQSEEKFKRLGQAFLTARDEKVSPKGEEDVRESTSSSPSRFREKKDRRYIRNNLDWIDEFLTLILKSTSKITQPRRFSQTNNRRRRERSCPPHDSFTVCLKCQ